ncbi:GNAT family N-acetyltransferase [Burkholderia plantarii]|nr:GNAT family N-acetyltransferase [Burkholderia plantarii]ALK32508.1 histone acetyltransferase HPA5 [Burkholderia plantarii]WLE61592.1 GNAT family N-acetyltransferase [Burkholderia plantarii]GLZ19881.1 N-acetyltransferase [Burkholderia plantarii]
MSPTYDILDTTPLDPIAAPLLDGLAVEYATRYADVRPGGLAEARDELATYPVAHFAPPAGAFVLLLHAGTAVGGGAFQRYDAHTAELKRIWTHDDWRRRGVARQVLDALETRARAQGYRRVYLTTGFRQPEAAGLYDAAGYARLYDPAIPIEVHWRLPFGKDLLSPRRTDSLADLRRAGPLGRR